MRVMTLCGAALLGTDFITEISSKSGDCVDAHIFEIAPKLVGLQFLAFMLYFGEECDENKISNSYNLHRPKKSPVTIDVIRRNAARAKDRIYNEFARDKRRKQKLLNDIKEQYFDKHPQEDILGWGVNT